MTNKTTPCSVHNWNSCLGAPWPIILDERENIFQPHLKKPNNGEPLLLSESFSIALRIWYYSARGCAFDGCCSGYCECFDIFYGIQQWCLKLGSCYHSAPSRSPAGHTNTQNISALSGDDNAFNGSGGGGGGDSKPMSTGNRTAQSLCLYPVQQIASTHPTWNALVILVA